MGSHIVYIDGALRSQVGKRYKQVKTYQDKNSYQEDIHCMSISSVIWHIYQTNGLISEGILTASQMQVAKCCKIWLSARTCRTRINYRVLKSERHSSQVQPYTRTLCPAIHNFFRTGKARNNMNMTTSKKGYTSYQSSCIIPACGNGLSFLAYTEPRS